MGRNLFLVYSSPVEGKLDEYHAWYDQHVIDISKVKGFASAQRFELNEEISESSGATPRRFLVVYEIVGDAGEAMANLREAAISGAVERPDPTCVIGDYYGQHFRPIRDRIVNGGIES